MKAIVKVGVAQATKFVDGHVKGSEYGQISNYALKVFEQFYNPKSNGLSEKDLAMGIVLHDILNQGDVTIQQIEKSFNADVALIVFNTNDYEDDYKLKGYEKVFKAYDFIFVKLIIRIARIHVAIANIESDKFRDYIDEYNELRRKLLKGVSDDNIMALMDYESDLIKYGRNIFAGKPANNYKYEKLVVNA